MRRYVGLYGDFEDGNGNPEALVNGQLELRFW